MRLLGHFGGPSLGKEDVQLSLSVREAGFWTSYLWVEAITHILGTLASVPSGILYKVLGYSESLPHSSEHTL